MHGSCVEFQPGCSVFATGCKVSIESVNLRIYIHCVPCVIYGVYIIWLSHKLILVVCTLTVFVQICNSLKFSSVSKYCQLRSSAKYFPVVQQIFCALGCANLFLNCMSLLFIWVKRSRSDSARMTVYIGWMLNSTIIYWSDRDISIPILDSKVSSIPIGSRKSIDVYCILSIKMIAIILIY